MIRARIRLWSVPELSRHKRGKQKSDLTKIRNRLSRPPCLLLKNYFHVCCTSAKHFTFTGRPSGRTIIRELQDAEPEAHCRDSSLFGINLAGGQRARLVRIVAPPTSQCQVERITAIPTVTRTATPSNMIASDGLRGGGTVKSSNRRAGSHSAGSARVG